jgi:ribosomal protein L37E
MSGDTPRCLRCGSDSVIPDARALAPDGGGSYYPLEVGVQKNPAALVLKGDVRSKTRAQVCADCGFAEVYAVDPEALWQAHLDRIANGWAA